MLDVERRRADGRRSPSWAPAGCRSRSSGSPSSTSDEIDDDETTSDDDLDDDDDEEGEDEAVNIDLAALRALEREREIPFETILAAIETALLTAYRHTEGANPHARVEIDRKTGAATVLAQELDDDGTMVREYDDTPHDFGRIAAMTAKQVILQRLREATDEVHFGEYVGRDGDLVTGVIQAHEARGREGHRHRRPRQDRGDAAARPSRCPASGTSTVSGSSASWCTW